ncbi:MAG TPA: helix-turn-helix domain-containing protein [Parapedobacter sp.]|uniref:helix-turn-helix transcriptional regulator n=1 Tax=Parapedobacter sp. TaxID=1958893 RepID=UPI002B8DE26F|nr:helix-turn-helix domain-containing protein [Parapedobacter sp.]HWK57152.1 helix-turn-helix domain-containing protein [Parapedobacter sp.]
METSMEKYKGIHPGLILEHELKKRKIAKNQFATAINQHRQTLNAITKGRRKLPVELSFKIDKELGYAEGTMLMMQTYFEIEDYRKKQRLTKTSFALGKLRNGLFWDTDISKIDPDIHATAIIRRVFERGNAEEKEYITDYYGDRRIAEVLGTDSIVAS